MILFLLSHILLSTFDHPSSNLYFFKICFKCLNVGGVKHDSYTSSHGLGRQVSLESASNHAVGTMRTADLAPLHSKVLLGTTFLSTGSSLGLGDKGNFLSAVEFGIGLGIDILNFNEGNVLVLVSLPTLVSENSTFHKQTWGAFGSSCLGHLERMIGLYSRERETCRWQSTLWLSQVKG